MGRFGAAGSLEFEPNYEAGHRVLLRVLQQFFEKQVTVVVEDDHGEARERAYRLATAALLVEMSRADFDIKGAERNAITHALQQAFTLSTAETDELVALAEDQADRATSLFEFTRLINQNFTSTQKEYLVELLWRVAFADGELDRYEEHLVRKVADLIHVRHMAFLKAKHRAKRFFESSPDTVGP